MEDTSFGINFDYLNYSPNLFGFDNNSFSDIEEVGNESNSFDINKEDKIVRLNNIPWQEQSTGATSRNQNLIGKKTVREDIKEKNRGRKKKSSNEVGTHTKYSADNIIIKIKITILNSIKDLLNSSFIYLNSNQKQFLKLVKGKNKSIKREDNLELISSKIKDIFSEDISSKYSANDKNHNLVLIQKIYEERKETDIIQILELTFGDLLNIFRGTISPELENKISHINYIKEKFRCLPDYLEKIISEEKKNGETEDNIKAYVDKIKDLCMNFEDWFNRKRIRKSKKEDEVIIAI